MIYLKTIDQAGSKESACTLYADTKGEVPATGKETKAKGFDGKLAPSSTLYTASMDVAVLDSNDKWNWV